MSGDHDVETPFYDELVEEQKFDPMDRPPTRSVQQMIEDSWRKLVRR